MKNIDVKIFLILLIGALVRIYGMMTLSLGEWDERFHALVAKNLMNDPLHPILISENLVKLDPNDWSMCHIWLAKPPLALWTMALSLKIFGINELGLRLPSLLFSMISIYLTYAIGKKLFNEKVALIAAFLYAVNGLLYEINIGLLSGDHVDTLLHLLFQSSIYFVLHYSNLSSQKLGIILGILIGLAFLTKWTMALLIWTVLAAYFLATHRKRSLSIILSMSFIAIFISLPWVLWIFSQFPKEAYQMMQGLIHPVTTVIQNHDGSWYYYLNSIRININELVYLPLILLMVRSFRHLNNEKLLLMFWIFIPLILLSISATKREVYIMISATPMFISIGWMMVYLSKIKAYRKLSILFTVLIFGAAIRYSIERIKPWKSRLEKPEYRIAMENLLNNSKAPADSIILINEPKYLDARFYYKLLAYRFIDDKAVFDIKNKGFVVYENVKGSYVEK